MIGYMAEGFAFVVVPCAFSAYQAYKTHKERTFGALLVILVLCIVLALLPWIMKAFSISSITF